MAELSGPSPLGKAWVSFKDGDLVREHLNRQWFLEWGVINTPANPEALRPIMNKQTYLTTTDPRALLSFVRPRLTDATPAKLLLDNNLSALPDDYQDYIIGRYRAEWKRGLVDANSGFEPHTFTERTLERWKAFPLACWRFGYDDLTERDQALEMMRLLRTHGYHGEKVRVYTMIGNEPIADCHRRIREVIANGMHPWPQRRRPLDWREGPLPCLFDWDEPTLIAYQRFYSIAGLWGRMKPEEFFYQGRYPLVA